MLNTYINYRLNELARKQNTHLSALAIPTINIFCVCAQCADNNVKLYRFLPVLLLPCCLHIFLKYATCVIVFYIKI